MLTRAEALAIYHAGPETVVRVLLEMDARNSSKPSSTDGFQKPAPLGRSARTCGADAHDGREARSYRDPPG
jgi:hypothetical protein